MKRRLQRGQVNLLYVCLVVLVIIVIAVLLGAHPTL
jgi:hypothetical protein